MAKILQKKDIAEQLGAATLKKCEEQDRIPIILEADGNISITALKKGGIKLKLPLLLPEDGLNKDWGVQPIHTANVFTVAMVKRKFLSEKVIKLYEEGE